MYAEPYMRRTSDLPAPLRPELGVLLLSCNLSVAKNILG